MTQLNSQNKGPFEFVNTCSLRTEPLNPEMVKYFHINQIPLCKLFNYLSSLDFDEQDQPLLEDLTISIITVPIIIMIIHQLGYDDTLFADLQNKVATYQCMFFNKQPYNFLLRNCSAHLCIALAVYLAGPQYPYPQDATKVLSRYIEDYLLLPLPDGIAPKLQAYMEAFASRPGNALDGLFDQSYYLMADKIYDLRIYYHELLVKCSSLLPGPPEVFNLPKNIQQYCFLDAYNYVTPVDLQKQFPPQSVKQFIIQQIDRHPQPLVDHLHATHKSSSCSLIETDIFDD